jgi:hypothetical protein
MLARFQSRGPVSPRLSPRLRLTLTMQLMTARGVLARNIYSVTAVSLGLVLLCWALLDWAGYTMFVFSLTWR